MKIIVLDYSPEHFTPCRDAIYCVRHIVAIFFGRDESRPYVLFFYFFEGEKTVNVYRRAI